MTEQDGLQPADAASWRPTYLPPLPAPAGPPPIADFVPVLTTALPPTPEIAAAAPLPRPELVTVPKPTVAPTPAALQEPLGGREKGERVELAGYVAGTPWFGTDRRGVPTCIFPLATHPEPDTTVTWRVRAKRERAERLRGNIRRGDAVVVVGYLHQEVFTREDVERVSEIVNLTALKKATGEDLRK